MMMTAPANVGQTKKGPSYDEALPAFHVAGATSKVVPLPELLGRMKIERRSPGYAVAPESQESLNVTAF